MNSESNLEALFDKVLQSTVSKVDRLMESTHAFWNALISLNGIFLSFFTILSDKSLFSKAEIILFGILTCLPILIVLFFYLMERHFQIKVFEISHNNNIKLLKNSNGIDEGMDNDKSESIKNSIVTFNKLQKVLEPIAISCTILAVFFMFFLLIAMKLQYC